MANKRRAYVRDYYRRKRDDNPRYQDAVKRHNATSLSRRKENKLRLLELRGNTCSICGGVFDPVCLDLHHRDPGVKDGNLAGLFFKPWHKIEAEVQKCDVVCANCHRLLHKDEGYTHLQGRVLGREYENIAEGVSVRVKAVQQLTLNITFGDKG